MAKKIVTEDGEIKDADETVTIKIPFWKTPYNHDTTADALASATINNEPTATQQHHRDESDINEILRKFGLNGELPPAPLPHVFDAPEIMDMQTAMEIVRQGEEAFMALPAGVRKMFDNDLARYSGYVDDRVKAGDWQTLKALGLDVQEPPPAPAPATGETPATKTDT